MIESPAAVVTRKFRYGGTRRRLSRHLRGTLPVTELSEAAVRTLALATPRNIVYLT